MSLIAVLIFASASPGAAFDPKAHDTELESVLEKNDYVALRKLLSSPKSQEETRANLDWMGAHWTQGTTAFVPMIYAGTLWAMTETAPEEIKKGLRGTAAAAMLYTYGVTFIDGARCGDKTAPQHRRDQLATFIPGFWSEIKNYSFEDRKMILEVAVGMERKTAAVRDAEGDVGFMCVNGMEEMAYNLRHGSVKEVPAQPGQIGRQMSVVGDGTYKPSLLDEKDWKPIAAKARNEMPATLIRFLLTDAEASALSKAH